VPEPLNSLAAIYSALAEILVSRQQEDLPPWIATAGSEWPIFQEVVRLANISQSQSYKQAVTELSEIPTAPLPSRWAEFESITKRGNSHPVWLHESMYVDGRIPGPTTFKVKSLYKLAGLEIVGAELADHISLELKFIAFLIRQEYQDEDNANYWNTARQLFIQQHAQRWVPQVGVRFARSSDPAWNFIGQLLETILFAHRDRFTPKNGLLPKIEEVELCSLCGFCAQVCPTKALYIIEDETFTVLMINKDACIGCSKCERICPEHVLGMNRIDWNLAEEILFESPRVKCSECGQPMFSQAEFNFSAARLDNPSWLSLCISCRTKSVTTLSNNKH
jgi:ferredoxin